MRSTVRRACLLFALFVVAATAPAQRNTVAAGGDATGVGGSVSYSIGQVDAIAISSTAGSVQQGVQQPYVIAISTGTPEPGVALAVAHPNPTRDDLWLTVPPGDGATRAWMLTDPGGRALAQGAVSAVRTTIPMAGLPPAVYLLHVSSAGRPGTTFRVIKQ